MQIKDLDPFDKTIREYVEQHNGAHARQIARALNKSDNTIRWRLLKLKARNILKSIWDPCRKKYYPEK